jgi:WAS family protein 1
VKQIQGTKKATTVHSPAKYPAPEKLREFSPIYSDVVEKSKIKHSAYKLQDEAHVSNSHY